MRKKLSALILAGLLLSSPALAAGPVVIAVVDGEKLITQSAAGKAAIAEMERLKNAKQKEIDAREAAAKSTKANLDAKGASLSEDARRAQELKLQRELNDLQIYVRDAQEQLKRKELALMKPINQDLEKVIGDYSKRNGIDLVLNRNDPGLINASARMDITAKVLEEYNRYHQTKKPAKPQAKKK
ncbi:MAG: Outer membrane protein (OmpH-like) [Deltaproteobacteria bacterium ADurb.Bin510]|nr:MAG: Outer membrane protein (OmpH-like) [Deltaproteobacteria bacterium ADurb.Bin510]